MNSIVRHVAPGDTASFAIPFPYLLPAHVVVAVDGIAQVQGAHFDVNGSTVTFRDQFIPAVGATVEVRRRTSPDGQLTSFLNGAVLTAGDLNTAVRQNFYLTQEIVDLYEVNLTDGLGRIDTPTIDGIIQDMLSSAAAAELYSRVTDIDENAEAVLSNLAILNGEILDRAQGDLDLQVQLNQLVEATAGTVYVQASAPVPGVAGVPDPIPTGARWYDSDSVPANKPYLWDGTVWISLEDPRIAANEADITAIDVRLTTAEGDIDANAGAISVLDTTVTDLNGTVLAQANDITVLQTGLTDANTDITANATAVSSLNSRVTTAEGNIASQASLITGLQSSLTTANGNITANASALSTLSTQVTSIDGEVTANASAITALTATVNGHTSSITTLQSVDAGLLARYGVQLNVNGHVSGFVQNNDGVTSDFIVAADKFAIVSSSGGTPKVPFLVSGGIVYMQNVVIGGALISSLEVSKITGGTLGADINVGSAGKIRGAKADYGAATAGFFLGYSGGQYKFDIGNSTKYLRWDGTNLTVGGDIIATGNLQNGAVSAVDYDYTAGTTFGSTTWTDLTGAADITYGGTGVVLVEGLAQIELGIPLVSDPGSVSWHLEFRLLRDGTDEVHSIKVASPIWFESGGFWYAGYDGSGVIKFYDVPTAGAHSYKLQARVVRSGWTATCSISKRLVTATLLKK